LDQLLELDDVEARRMFGGYGLYQDETFFGIIHNGRLYFKVDEHTVAEYRKRKMKAFRPNAKQTLKSYYRCLWRLSKTPINFANGRRRRSIGDGKASGVMAFLLAARGRDSSWD
jgi:DNA transformation protein